MIEHGGNALELANSYGFDYKDCIDFSANINPLGVSNALKSVLIESLDNLTVYPDIHYQESHEFLADCHQCTRENILLGNGAVEIFYDLARYLVPRKLLILAPTFMEYEKAFRQVGSDVKLIPFKSPSYKFDLKDILGASEELEAGDVLIVCNPNNPTGSLILAEDLKTIAANLTRKNAYLVIDEAFIDFLEDDSDYSFLPFLRDHSNVIVVRSLTKFYAIPGLRLGYAVSYFTECFKDIKERRAPWGINVLADKAVPTLLRDYEYQSRTRDWVKKERTYLYQSLSMFSQINAVEPSANYIFFEYLGQRDLREELRKEKIFIRSCSNYHVLGDSHYRVAVRSRLENDRLLNILKEICY